MVPGRPGCLVTESAPGRPGYTVQVPGLTGCLWGRWVPGRPGCPLIDSCGCQDDLGAQLPRALGARTTWVPNYR